jgi:hypothetical protein
VVWADPTFGKQNYYPSFTELSLMKNRLVVQQCDDLFFRWSNNEVLLDNKGQTYNGAIKGGDDVATT